MYIYVYIYIYVCIYMYIYVYIYDSEVKPTRLLLNLTRDLHERMECGGSAVGAVIVI